MATAKEREEFLALMVREFPNKSLPDVMEMTRKLMRLAKRHGNLAVEQCNGPQHLNRPSPYDYKTQPAEHAEWQKRNGAEMEAWEIARQKREDACEKRITELLAPFDLVPTFGGDPRGYTVKLQLPSGKYNTWGGSEEGCGVPQ